MKNTITSLLLILLSCSLQAQNKVDEIMYKAYLSDADATAAWKSAVEMRMAALGLDEKSSKARFGVALAQFGLLSSTMRWQNEDLFDEYYKDTEKNLEEIIEADKKWAEPYALLSAIYGLKMGYSPLQAMFLGGKSNNLIEKAKKLDPTSPLAWKVLANAKFFTPTAFGGDIDESIEAYEKCIALYEARPELLKQNWMYLDALAFMGQAYMKNGDAGKAIAVYEKALAAEPEFGWVKFVLLPKAKSKTAK